MVRLHLGIQRKTLKVIKTLVALNMNMGTTDPFHTLCCHNAHGVCDKIVEASRGFDYFFTINDAHNIDDNEFKYLPSHRIRGQDDSILLTNYYNQIECPKAVLSKNTLNGVFSKHNQQIISSVKPGLIRVCGFCTTSDVMSTSLAMMDLGFTVDVRANLVSDLTEDLSDEGCGILKFLGILQ